MMTFKRMLKEISESLCYQLGPYGFKDDAMREATGNLLYEIRQYNEALARYLEQQRG